MEGTRGKLIVFYGAGVGKTSAALGRVARALGRGKKVVIIHFLKGIESGENMFYTTINGTYGNNIEVHLRGFDRFYTNEKDREEFLAKTIEGLETARKALEKRPYLLVLDEILWTIETGLLSTDQILEIVRNRGDTNVILTGRNAPEEIKQEADMVTRFEYEKHYYEQEKKPIMGLDY